MIRADSNGPSVARPPQPPHPPAWLLAAWVLLGTLFSGCQDANQVRRPERPSKTEGLYGPVADGTVPGQKSPRDGGIVDPTWTNASFAVVESEFTPAILVHSTSSYLGLFRDLESRGLESPTHVAFSAMSGPKGFKKGDILPVIGMEENWLVVWFAGGRGWTNWDIPWAVFLQHKPIAMILDDSGLHLQFRKSAGDIVMMPMYGALKLPVQGADFAPFEGLPSAKLKPWEWTEFLPKDFLMRVRYWASASRRLPLSCEDTFQVNRARDTVTLRQRFGWHAIDDAWGTKPLKVAPVSPVLALAALDENFPGRFSSRPANLDFATPWGPYKGVEGTDEYEVTFELLQYVNDMAAPSPAAHGDSGVNRQSLDRLRQAMRETFADHSVTQDPFGPNRTPQARILEATRIAKALPYCEDPIRSKAASALREFLTSEVLIPDPSASVSTIPEAARSGAVAIEDASPSQAPDAMELLWAYAHHSGDWDLIRSNWSGIVAQRDSDDRAGWIGFGSRGLAGVGSAAVSSLAMARMAYRMGDLPMYRDACLDFVREVAADWGRLRGGEYFRRHQPLRTLEPMAVGAVPSRLDEFGWRLSGPATPGTIVDDSYARRWAGFDNEDYAGLLRDHPGLGAARDWSKWWDGSNESPGAAEPPATLRLRRLVGQGMPEVNSSGEPPMASGATPSEVVAVCLPVPMADPTIGWVRLIPGDAPSPLASAPDRAQAEAATRLTQRIFVTAANGQESPPGTGLDWPEVGVRQGGGASWTVGRIVGRHEGKPGMRRDAGLSGNARVTILE